MSKSESRRVCLDDSKLSVWIRAGPSHGGPGPPSGWGRAGTHHLLRRPWSSGPTELAARAPLKGHGPRPAPPSPSRVRHLSGDLLVMPQATPPRDQQGPRGASARAALDLRALQHPVRNLPENRPRTVQEPISSCRQMLGLCVGSWPDFRDADSGVTGHRTCVWAAGLADAAESSRAVGTLPSSAQNRPSFLL